MYLIRVSLRSKRKRGEIMKLTKGLEQAVCIITLLATQEKEIPVSSFIINQRLQGSPTYIKKLMRKLVVNDLVNSVSGINGGFTLAKRPQNITLLDIIEALEGPIITYPNTGLINMVFQDMQPVATQGDLVLTDVFQKADTYYTKYLNQQTVEDLIQETLGLHEIPVLHWNDLAEKKGLLRKVLNNVNGNDEK